MAGKKTIPKKTKTITKKSAIKSTATQKQKFSSKDILIQAGLAVYFTAYFIAHHFLGAYNVRWIFYVGLATMAIYAIKTKQKKETKFAEGFCFNKVFLIYVIGCMIGTYYEEILTFCRTGNWLSRQGIIYGPFNPVYGAGFLVFTLLLCRNLKRKWWLTYIYACFIGGATEMVSSLISEYVFKANAWDYSDKFLNIWGRTTIPYMLFWGAGGLIFVKLVFPALSKFIELLPKRIGNAIMPTFLIFVILSHVVSYTALFRYGTRSDGGQTTITNAKLNSASGYALYINKGSDTTTDTTTEITGQIYNQNNTLTMTGGSVKKSNGNSVTLIENTSDASFIADGTEIELTTNQADSSTCYNAMLGDNVCRNSVIANKGTVTISNNASIKLLAKDNTNTHNDVGIINVGAATITQGTIDIDGEGCNGDFYGIYTKGGTATITSGHVDVKAGKATGVYVDNDGTFEMGTANPGHGRTDIADKTNPYIKAVGGENGIGIDNNHLGRFNWYDGKVIGSHVSSNPLAPNLIEEYYEVKESTNGDGYKEANLDLMFENGS